MPTEESGTTPVAPVEGAAPVQPEVKDPPAAAAPDPAAGATAAPVVKGWDAFKGWVTDSSGANPAESDEPVFGEFDRESFDRLDPKAQLVTRAAYRFFEKQEAERAAAREAERAEIAKEKERIKAAEKALRGREQAMLELAATAKPPEQGDDIDPFTPDGAAKLAERKAQEALYAAQEPMRRRAAEIQLKNRMDALFEQYPDLKKPKVKAEFDAWLLKENEGVDMTQPGARPRRTTEDGAELFFLRRATTAAAERERADRAAQDAERARAAAHVGGSSGTAVADPLATYDQIRKTQGWDRAQEYLDQNPKAQAAYLRRYNQTANA